MDMAGTSSHSMCGIIIRENLAKENMDYEIGLTYENEMEKEESMRKMHKAHFDEAEEIKPQKCERIVIQTKYRMCACEWSPSHGTWFAAAAPSTSDWRLCYRLPNYNTAHANALPCCLFLLFIFFSPSFFLLSFLIQRRFDLFVMEMMFRINIYKYCVDFRLQNSMRIFAFVLSGFFSYIVGLCHPQLQRYFLCHVSF